MTKYHKERGLNKITKIIATFRTLLKPQYKQSKKNQSDYIPESEKRFGHLFHWYPNLLPGEMVEWQGILSLCISGCSSGNLHNPRLVYFTSERIVWRFYGDETGWEPFTEIPYSKIRYIRRSLGSFLGSRSTKSNELYVDYIHGTTFIDHLSDLSRCEQIIRKASSFHGKVEEDYVWRSRSKD